MGTYHPLTECQRYQMYALKKAGHDQPYAVCGTAHSFGQPATVGGGAGWLCIGSHYRRLQRFLSSTWSPPVATQRIFD